MHAWGRQHTRSVSRSAFHIEPGVERTYQNVGIIEDGDEPLLQCSCLGVGLQGQRELLIWVQCPRWHGTKYSNLAFWRNCD